MFKKLCSLSCLSVLIILFTVYCFIWYLLTFKLNFWLALKLAVFAVLIIYVLIDVYMQVNIGEYEKRVGQLLLFIVGAGAFFAFSLPIKVNSTIQAIGLHVGIIIVFLNYFWVVKTNTKRIY